MKQTLGVSDRQWSTFDLTRTHMVLPGVVYGGVGDVVPAIRFGFVVGPKPAKRCPEAPKRR